MTKFVFCLPGISFSNRFLRSWTALLYRCLKDYKIDIDIRGGNSSNIYIVRNICLGAVLEGPEDQKPFQGEVDYGYIMWIDSDNIFEPDQFKMLLDRMESDKNLHILSGLYYPESKGTFVASKNGSTESFKKNRRPLFLTPEDIKGETEPIEVESNGMGFM